jgi:hypothetical protein
VEFNHVTDEMTKYLEVAGATDSGEGGRALRAGGKTFLSSIDLALSWNVLNKNKSIKYANKNKLFIIAI